MRHNASINSDYIPNGWIKKVFLHEICLQESSLAMEKVLMLLASEYFAMLSFRFHKTKSCVLVHFHTETAPVKRLAFVNPARRHACYYSKHTTRLDKLLKTMCVLRQAEDDFFPCQTFSMPKKSKTVKEIVLKLGDFCK